MNKDSVYYYGEGRHNRRRVMKTILVVDDNVINLKAIKRLLTDTYKVIPVNSAADAFAYLETNIPDLILLDVMMPETDGFTMMRILQKSSVWSGIPVIFITADTDKDKELEGFRMGAMDFIVKPFEPDIVRIRIARTLELETLRHNLEEEVRDKTAEIENITLQSIMAVANMVDSKDRFAQSHSVNVAAISEEIARRLGWNDGRITNLHYLALLHDIGKIGIPDSIFNKKGLFSKDDFDIVKRHTEIGAEILEGISIENVKVGAKYHHERYDGKGYGCGLSGEDIPIEARIIAVADAYDAMSHDRAYRPKRSHSDIIAEFQRERGGQFDPKIVDVFMTMLEEGCIDSLRCTETSAEKGIAGESTNLLQKVVSEYANEAIVESNKDPLTGLWNRKYTVVRVDKLLAESVPHGAAFMVDIDNFKGINDTFGHICGDEILLNISKVIFDIVRQDDVACRIGGDEFFIYFNGLSDSKKAAGVAQRLIRALNDNVKYPDRSRGVSASVGIAMAPKDGSDFEKLYSNSDKALYYAKNNGKNTYHFYSGDNYAASTGKGIKEDLMYIRQMLIEQEPVKGSYYVEYEGFKNIARFIRRGLERNKRHITYVLFTLEEAVDALPADSMQEYIESVEDSIKMCLRVGDVTTRYSSSQVVAILVDASESDAEMVVKRILEDLYRKGNFEEVVINYDIQELDLADKDRRSESEK